MHIKKVNLECNTRRRIRYWLVPQTFRLETNLVYLAKGDFLKNAPNAPRSDDTLYAAFDVTASF